MLELQHHPAASAFPMMSADRATELADDIRAHGLRIPIVLAEGMILDGRNRHRACIEVGVAPTFTEFHGDPWAYVWSLNGQRRDLNDEQRYLIWKFCHEQSDEWIAARDARADAANAARSEKAKAQHEVSKPYDGERMVREHSVRTPSSRDPERKSKASLSKTNLGAVARGDKLAKERPDLAQKVMRGEIKPAEAHRELRRAEIVSRLEDTAAKQAKEIAGVYDVLVIDPPWPMEKIERDERTQQVAFDYPTMDEGALCDMELPAADDAHVWLWTTHRFLPMAFRLLDAWGLKYVCTFVWHKPGGFQPVGLPQFNCEFALYARKGTPAFIDTKGLPTCFDAPRAGHSVKPEEFYAMVRRCTAGRRLDMFNRRVIEGFDGWGKEAAA